MKIILCGPPCSGKSVIAKLLSRRQNVALVDTDGLIEDGKKTCGEIYRDEGEAVFREREARALQAIPPMQDAVIALGGGILEIPQLWEGATVILLQASIDTLWSRLQSRPKLPAYLSDGNPREAFEQRISSRQAAYVEMAHHTIHTDELTPEEVVDRIYDYIKKRKKKRHGIK